METPSRQLELGADMWGAGWAAGALGGWGWRVGEMRKKVWGVRNIIGWHKIDEGKLKIVW